MTRLDALRNELGYLHAQPTVNTRRVGEVEAEIAALEPPVPETATVAPPETAVAAKPKRRTRRTEP